MYQYGLGCNQDLHLAKRHYDACIQYDSTGYVPCKIASVYTSMLIQYNEWIQWISSKSNNKIHSTATHSHHNNADTIGNTDSSSSSDAINSHDHSDSMHESSSTSNRRHISNKHSLYTAYLYVEDIVLISLCFILGMIVYKRANPTPARPTNTTNQRNINNDEPNNNNNNNAPL